MNKWDDLLHPRVTVDTPWSLEQQQRAQTTLRTMLSSNYQALLASVSQGLRCISGPPRPQGVRWGANYSDYSDFTSTQPALPLQVVDQFVRQLEERVNESYRRLEEVAQEQQSRDRLLLRKRLRSIDHQVSEAVDKRLKEYFQSEGEIVTEQMRTSMAKDLRKEFRIRYTLYAMLSRLLRQRDDKTDDTQSTCVVVDRGTNNTETFMSWYSWKGTQQICNHIRDEEVLSRQCHHISHHHEAAVAQVVRCLYEGKFLGIQGQTELQAAAHKFKAQVTAHSIRAFRICPTLLKDYRVVTDSVWLVTQIRLFVLFVSCQPSLRPYLLRLYPRLSIFRHHQMDTMTEIKSLTDDIHLNDESVVWDTVKHATPVFFFSLDKVVQCSSPAGPPSTSPTPVLDMCYFTNDFIVPRQMISYQEDTGFFRVNYSQSHDSPLHTMYCGLLRQFKTPGAPDTICFRSRYVDIFLQVPQDLNNSMTHHCQHLQIQAATLRKEATDKCNHIVFRFEEVVVEHTTPKLLGSLFYVGESGVSVSDDTLLLQSGYGFPSQVWYKTTQEHRSLLQIATVKSMLTTYQKTSSLILHTLQTPWPSTVIEYNLFKLFQEFQQRKRRRIKCFFLWCRKRTKMRHQLRSDGPQCTLELSMMNVHKWSWGNWQVHSSLCHYSYVVSTQSSLFIGINPKHKISFYESFQKLNQTLSNVFQTQKQQ